MMSPCCLRFLRSLWFLTQNGPLCGQTAHMLILVAFRSGLSRVAWAMTVLAVLLAAAQAQVKVGTPPVKSPPADAAKPQPRLVRMTVSPAPAPRGALRYRLLPE